MIVYDTQTTDIEKGGGKGSNLLRLKMAGFRVPPFLILTPESFDPYGRISPADAAAVRQYFPGEQLLAVRSSASLEDSAGHSFAGQFSTRLSVSKTELEEAIASVWSSGTNAAVAAYKEAHRITAIHQMSVIIQQMIPATTSGVAFGIHPLTGNKKERVINAVSGTGEALVNGSVNADSYLLTAGNLTSSTLRTPDHPLLTDAQLKEIDTLLQQLEVKLGGPQDIEFAYHQDTFYLLQARPVTAVRQAQAIIWDNSNIVESYPGLTLPATFSFIQKMYEAVYRQFSAIMGVQPRTVEANREVYASMLGILNGRVYYNLNSWFAALAQLPGYNINAGFMEKMMGVKEAFPLKIKTSTKPGIGDYRQIIRALFFITKNGLTARRQRDSFISFFNRVYNEYNEKDYSALTLAQLLKDYTAFEQLMVSRWKAPLVNDFFAMIYFGILQKLTAKYAPQHRGLHNELVAFSNEVITTEPIRLLPQLANNIAGNAALRDLFLNALPEAILQQITQPEHARFKALFDEYIEKWGDRSLAELKLETVTYRQQPTMLISLLQGYVQQQLFSYEQNKVGDVKRKEAEAAVRRSLRGKPFKRLLFNHVLKQARYFVTNRENLRYYRTMGFGMVRRLLLAAGDKLKAEGRLGETADIFYLKLEEILHTNFSAAIIPQRKKDYGLYEKLSLPQRVVTQGQPGRFLLEAVPRTGLWAAQHELTGLPCSAGVVQAKVRLIRHPSEIASMSGCILATYSTDPGWVVLFPSAAGILTERGSLLSHAAIVSREMGLPCIVGIEGLMHTLKDGDEIIMDGATGRIKIITA